jgi:DNA (cytosine-5)-methyltransferase 1
MNALSFFSGCMGLDIGLKKAGINTLLACDFDKNCRDTIKSNCANLPVLTDILDYDAKTIRAIAGLKDTEKPDLIVGGPPCQAFSTAGKRQSFKDPRGNVFLHFLELIGELQPKYVVIENVRGLLSASLRHVPHAERGEHYKTTKEELSGSALMMITKILQSHGYSVTFNLYNAANFGVPQKRERVVILATLSDRPMQYLRPTHATDGEFGLLRWTSFRSAVNGLKENEMSGLTFPEKRLKYYKLLKPGEYWKHLPSEELKMEALGKSYFSGGGKTGFLRRLNWDLPSPTLVTHPAMPATDLAHPELDRPLTVEEYKRIQQFPDDWVLKGSTIQQYKQLGNAVPVGLGHAIGRAILEHANEKSWDVSSYKGFPYSRYKHTDDITWNIQMDKRVRLLEGLTGNFELDLNS